MKIMKKAGAVLALAACLAAGGPAEAATEEEQQLDLLSAQNQIWEKNMCIGECIAQDGKLAVTDLDNNGRLELLFTTTIGDEEYIENWGYEVNETGDGVSLVRFPDGMQIGLPRVRMYFACQIGTRHYLFQTSQWRPAADGGWSRSGGLFGLCLRQGQFRAELLGRYYEVHQGRGLPSIGTIYRDRDAKVIDEAAYNKLARDYYDNYHPFEVTLGWTGIAALADAMGDREKVRAVFAKSWAGFSAKEIDEGPVHH